MPAYDRPMPDPVSPIAAYRAKLQEGALKSDPLQALAVEKLESLWRALKGYRPGPDPESWRARLGLFGAEAAPQGLYLFGGVGRGKSMVMDLFFASAPVDNKRRIHFHAFMLEVHERLHKWRAKDPADREGKDPIPPLARKLAEEAWLLCFDEFQVTDIADAMILARLLDELFRRGVVMVATSNTAPDDLYAGGLQRERFLPAIAAIQRHLDVIEVEGSLDYRRLRLAGMQVYFTPLGMAAVAALDHAFMQMTDGKKGQPERLIVQGRALDIRRAARGVAMTEFVELCERPLGAADYLAVATHFHTLILAGVPALGPDKRNEARRFTTLIDALYEHKAKLICSAAVEPEALYAEGDHQAEFRRAVSRLHEMRSETYLALPHLT